MSAEENGEGYERRYQKKILQLRKVMDTKVIGGNLMTALNSWAVVVMRYYVAFIYWTRLET